MAKLTPYMHDRLRQRELSQEKRILPKRNWRFDFASNDYLGFARSSLLRDRIVQACADLNAVGASGSRLLTGNMQLAEEVESDIARFFGYEGALLFPSGFAMNCGLLAAISDTTDAIILDENIHASFKNGLKIAKAPGYFFRHNDLTHLAERLQRLQAPGRNLFVVVESLYSMDGDCVAMDELIALCERYDAHLIIDEAHAVGALGERGRGLSFGFQNKIFAKVITFGKAFGCHAGALLGSLELISYVQNFCHSFVYTTGLPTFSLVAIREALRLFDEDAKPFEQLHTNIRLVDSLLSCPERGSPIYSFPFDNTDRLRKAAAQLQEQGFGILPIYSPTVRKGSERLRMSVHAHNSESEIRACVAQLEEFI